MIIRMILTVIILSTIECKADLIVNSLFKYGTKSIGDNKSSTLSSSTSSKKSGVTTTNSTVINNVETGDLYGVTPGLGFEVVPQYGGVCVGAGYYMDNTIQMNLGWKIF